MTTKTPEPVAEIITHAAANPGWVMLVVAVASVAVIIIGGLFSSRS